MTLNGICPRRNQVDKSMQIRKLHLNKMHEQEYDFPDNKIRTTKYTVLTFLPMSFMIQFMNVVNVFYFFNGILQFIPSIQTASPLATYIPLGFIIVTGMIKEGVIDYKRYKSDRETNFKQCLEYKENAADGVKSSFQPVKWEELRVGSIVKLEDKEHVPADIIIIASSENHGEAYCSTATLDGERTLKPKQAIAVLQQSYEQSEHQLLTQSIAEFECQIPDKSIYHFNGKVEIEGELYHMNIKNMLLRGSVMANTEFIIGIVAYTGKQTKIQLNSGKYKFKQSRADAITNVFLLIQLALLVVLVIWMGLMNYDFTLDNIQSDYLFYHLRSVSLFSFKAGLSYYLLLNQLIPIALVIATEISKIFQTLFIEQDSEMHSLELDQQAKCLSFNIHEDLGSIKHVFSDKTGTLTCNKLTFRGCTIGHKTFGSSDEEELIKRLRRFTQKNDSINNDISFEQIIINDDFVMKDMNEVGYYFFLNLCLCNDVVVVNSHGKEEYHGQSTDEITLLNFMKSIDYKMDKRTNNAINLSILSEENVEFKILEKFEFTSERKRMSVIVQMPDTNQIIMMTKGADQIMFSMESYESVVSDFSQEIKHKVHKFSCQGYRTLCMGVKKLDQQKYEQWSRRYNLVKQDLLISHEEKEREMQRLIEEIENNLFIIGATALEDQLQDKVPECIAEMRKAGIKVWMITGDKLETAENIGFSCKLFTEQTNIFRISDSDIDSISDKFYEMEAYLNQGKLPSNEKELWFSKSERSQQEIVTSFGSPKFKPDELQQRLIKEETLEQLGLVLQGHSFSILQSDPELVKQFLRITSRCDAIIICRASPSQKASVVSLIRSNLKKTNETVLAIGDGSNDVAMIHAAHIGIGLYGVEGTEASSSADYAIAEFKHLRRLLFFHGLNLGYKMNIYIQLFLFKSTIFAILPLYFAFFNGYSGEKSYEDVYLMLYKLLFTNIDLVAWLVMEQALPLKNKSKYYNSAIAYVYQDQRENDLYSLKKVIAWQLYCYIATGVVFIIPSFGMSLVSSPDGKDIDLYACMLCQLSIMVVTHSIQVIIFTQHFTWVTVFFYVLNLFTFFPAGIMINDSMKAANQYKNSWQAIWQWNFWLCLLIGVFINDVGLYIYYKSWKILKPRLADTIREEMSKLHRVDHEDHSTKQSHLKTEEQITPHQQLLNGSSVHAH